MIKTNCYKKLKNKILLNRAFEFNEKLQGNKPKRFNLL